jgi:seryl-tRNA synthetase
MHALAPGISLTDPGPGLTVLDPVQTALLRELEAVFLRFADDVGASEVVPPTLLPAAGLADLDYFKNFPHLCVTAERFSAHAAKALADGTAVDALPRGSRDETGYVLPSATCYGMLLSLRGVQLPEETRLTAVCRCHRNEDHFDGLRRLWGFHMREIVYLGTREGAEEHLQVSRSFIERYAERIGLELSLVSASDPFYDQEGSRATLTALDPVKHEFVSRDGTAIASVNRHRNFFGQRLGIGYAGQAVYSSCTAFGLERWIHALTHAYGSAARALAKVKDG